jgi:hypothetical protein
LCSPFSSSLSIRKETLKSYYKIVHTTVAKEDISSKAEFVVVSPEGAWACSNRAYMEFAIPTREMFAVWHDGLEVLNLCAHFGAFNRLPIIASEFTSSDFKLLTLVSNEHKFKKVVE